MTKYHINKKGEPGVCKALESCPLASSEQHFPDKESAREAFEKVMEPRQPLTPEEEADRKSAHLDQYELVVIMNDSVLYSQPLLELNGQSYMDFDAVGQDDNFGESRSASIAEFVREFSGDESMEEDGWKELEVVEHKPMGGNLDSRSANFYYYDGKTYVVDYSYAEIDPNHEWPYLDTEENWRKDIDRMSYLERPEREPEPVDPRALSIPIFAKGENNPLIDKAILEEPNVSRDGSKYRFLSIDQVRVAAVRYAEEDYGIQLHSIETRSEYRNQGYMKKLLSILKEESNSEIYSSSSYTPDGYHYTKHLTKTRGGYEDKITWPEYTGENSFSFIHSWISGVAHNY